MQRTRTTSTLQAVLQGCTHALAYAVPCFSMWIRIQCTGEPLKAAALSFPMAHSTGPCFQRSLCHTTTGGPLIDHNTGEPYPMAVTGDFCLLDSIFAGSPGDSLLFKEDDLDILKRKGFCISTYREKKPQPTIPKEDKHKSPHTKENMLSSSCREEESCKISGRNSGVSSSWAPDSTSSKKSSCWGKCSSLAKEQPDSHDTKDHCSSSSRHKDRFHSDKAADMALTRRAAVLPASMACHHLHALALWNAHGRNLMLMNPPVFQVRAHAPTTGTCLGV